MPPDSILQICLSPSWGGLEMVALETAVMLQAQGLHCWNLVRVNSPIAQRMKAASLPVTEIQPGALHLLRNIFALRKIIKVKNIQTVLVQHLHDLYLVRPGLYGFPYIRLIGFSHTFVNVYKRDLYHRRLYKRIQTLIALTSTHKENLLKYLAISEERIVTIPNSVDIALFNPRKRSSEIRKSLDPSEQQILIGLVGRLDKAKGQSLLIQAAALLSQKGINNFKIIFVGEETLNEPGILQGLKDLSQRLHLENEVLFTGFRGDIPEVMASLDIAVMASDAETFGRVIIEAMASGTAVIASRAGGVVDIIEDSKDGLLFTPRDEHSLSVGLETLIQNPELRMRISRAALEKVQKVYSRDVVKKKLLSIL